MARTRKSLPETVDMAHLISTGVLASVCPRVLIEEVLAQTGKASQRERLLPAPAVVYYVIALALWREAPLEEVLRVVCEGLQWLGGGQGGAVQASKSAISQARTRLGPEVMEQLAQRVLRPLARPGAPGAWYRGWRLMAVDGTCMDVADEAVNAQHFGYPAASRGQSAFPQARVLGLVECGTHAVVAAAIAPYGHSEVAMAAELLPPKLAADMLVMADRNFYSFKLWQKACASGAKLMWRVKSNLGLPVEQELDDGSYLSTVYDSEDDRAKRHGCRVRVIEYTLKNSATPVQDSYRLVTNILDPQAAPVLELAALYHERWEIEGVFDEIKTRMRSTSTVLREVYARARQHNNLEQAAEDLRAWSSWARRCRLEPFKKLAATIKDRFEAVVRGMLDHRRNAFVESMNGQLQQAKRAARGYRTAKNFIAIAYLRLSRLKHLPAHPFAATAAVG